MSRETQVKRDGLATTVERRGTSSGIALRHLSRPRLHVRSEWRRDWTQRHRFRGSDSQDNQDWRCLRVPTQAPILITPEEPRVLITGGGGGNPSPFWCLCQKLSLSLLYFNTTLLHKSSERLGLISGPGLSSPLEAKNPSVLCGLAATFPKAACYLKW